MTLTGPITEFRNSQAFRYAANCLKAGNRVVGFIMMGDSNQSNGGVGFYDGFIRALDVLGYKNYSTGTWGAFVNKGANNSLGQAYNAVSLGSGLIWSGLTNGLTSGATQQRGQITAAAFPDGLTPYCNGPWLEPSGAVATSIEGTAGWNCLEGLFWGASTTYNTAAATPCIELGYATDLRNPISVTNAFRGFHWFVKGPSTCVYQFGARNANSAGAYDSLTAFNYNALTPAAGSTTFYGATASTYGLTFAEIHYGADASRTCKVNVLQIKNNTNITGGAGCVLFSAAAVGVTSLSGGYFVSPAILYPSASLKNMLNQMVPATYGGATTIHNTWLDAYLQAQVDLVRSNASSGGSTAGALVFWINSGRNDKNDNDGSFNPISFTYSSTGPSSNSALGFKNNVKALINRIMARPPISSFYNGTNVCFLVAPSQRLTPPLWSQNSTQFNTVAGQAAPEAGCTAMQAFKDAAWDLTQETSYPVVAVDINELCTAGEWPYVYNATSTDHLSASVGYYLVSARMFTKLIQASYGLTGLTTSPWGSTPDQVSKPIWLNSDDREACRATNNGWELPIDGLTARNQYEVLVTCRGLASRISTSQDKTAPAVISPLQDAFGGTTYNGQYSSSLGAISYSTGTFTCVLRLAELISNPQYGTFTGAGSSTANAISATFASAPPAWLTIGPHQTIWNAYTLTGATTGLSGSVAYGTKYPIDLLLTSPSGATGIHRFYINTSI